MEYDDGRPPEENIAEALFTIARRLADLGNGNAATPMGAIEAYGAVVKENGEKTEHSLYALTQAIELAGNRIANALIKVAHALEDKT